MRSFGLGVILFATIGCLGQSVSTAKEVYSASQDSVFLVYLNDSTGNPGALGSAFLIAPKTLITNAHVAEAGEPVLAVGPVRIPLKVLRLDQQNDLAILSVEANLTSRPLPLSSETIAPGEQAFAIGNPEGLEKTISQGIVSGLRKVGDRNLLQITSPISHGSSGGPILNSKGEVVGVAVGVIEGGQNLNFAVPVEYVRSILQKREDGNSTFNLEGSIQETRSLLAKKTQAQYSDDPSSDYQKYVVQLKDLMGAIVAGTSKEDALIEMSCLGTRAIELSEIGVQAARKLNQETPSPEHRALLSYVLYDRAEDEGVEAIFAKDGSPEKASASAAREEFLTAASHEAVETARTAKGKTLLLADFVLGNTKNDRGEYADAISLHAQVASGSPQVCGDDLTAQVLRNLISESAAAKRSEDAEEWFKRYASLYEPSPAEWDSEGDRRSAANDAALAASSYEKAAAGSDYFGYDFCYAANQHTLQSVADPDGVLTDGRKCVEASVKQTDNNNDHYFKAMLPVVYRAMAEVLDDRGVYQPALEYAKESLANRPDDPFTLNTEAKIFANLERNSECIAAAQASINASDGKYPWMHFQLGYCFFAEQNWNKAAESFRISAESDNTDAVSAFNLGLSLSRQGFNSDAEHWFREALTRKPDDELRGKILSALK